MINLLPDDAKLEIYAARTNVTLVKYILVLSFGAAFLGLISVAVYFVLMSTEAGAKSIVTDNASKSNAYSSVQAQANGLKTSLISAKTILDKEVNYTKVLISIAKVMPAGTVLDTLSLSPTTLGSPITLQAYAKTNHDALALRDSFQKSPLFSSVTLLSMANNSTQAPGYPVSVSLNLTINKGAAL